MTIIGTGATPQSLPELLSPKHKGRQRHYEIWLLRTDGSRLRSVSRQPDFPQWVGSKHLLLGRETLPAQGGVKWDLLNLRGKRVARIVSEAPELLAWEVSPDGRYLAYVGRWPQVEISSCAVFLYKFSERRTIENYGIDVASSSIGWSPDSKYVYLARDWRLDVVGRQLEQKSKQRCLFFGYHDDFAVNDAGQILAAVSGVGLSWVNWETGREEVIAKGDFEAVAAFGRDPDVFVCSKIRDWPQNVDAWLGRLCNGAWQLSQLEGVQALAGDIALSRDSRRFAYEAPDGEVKVMNIPRPSR